MQLVLGCGACTGRWWSGVGSDEEGPSTERRHGRHGYKGSSGRGITGGEAVQSRRRRVYARRRMADSNPPDPH